MGRHFLYLNTRGLSAYIQLRDRMHHEASFVASEAGLADFVSFLAANKDGRFFLLANPRDESQEMASIPYLKGRDRQTLLTRKLTQQFPGSCLVTSLSLGYERTRRKNERILLTALSNYSDFEPWLARIAAAEVALVGLYSLSQLAAPLLRQAGATPGPALLFTIQDDSLRESFVDGECLFSRRIPIPSLENELPAPLFVQEAERLRHYLIGRQLIDRDEPIPVFVVCHASATEQLSLAFAGQDLLACRPLDGGSLARHLGLADFPVDSRSDSLFLWLLAKRPPRRQFAPAAQRRRYQLLRIRLALAGGAGAALLAAFGFAGAAYLDGRSYHLDTARYHTQEQEMSRRHHEISAGLPRLPISHDALEKLASRLSVLEQERRHPGQAFLSLSRVLDRTPMIELDAIDWHIRTKVGTEPKCCEEALVLEGSIRPESAPTSTPARFETFVAALEKEGLFRSGTPKSPETEGTNVILQVSPESRETSSRFTLHISRRSAP